ncbi:hypothetical protein MMC30_000332 [Trapelia coarctata]|nr:hypothetical protein [Trapelia coarctata]
MLDPFTALSLAGNVVQFVQFGSHLIAKAHDIHTSDSGVLEENLEMGVVTSRLLNMVVSLEQFQAMANTSGSNESEPRPREEKCLLEISEACKMLAGEILKRLEDLKVHGPPSAWTSVRKAFKAIWNKEELTALTKRFKAYISELDTVVLVSLKRNIDLVYYVTTQGFFRLDQASQRVVELLLLNRTIFTSEIRMQTREISGIIVSEQAQTRAMILDLIQQKGVSQVTSASYVQSTFMTAEATGSDVCEPDRSIRRCFLDSLGFPTMSNRRDEVAEAFHTTFEWIFQEPNSESEPLPWTNFASWLRHGNHIYWINGKAGSGKSTLMKYIFENMRTSQLLSQWSHSMPVMVANFFFWDGGTREQRSQLGFLRSLLFQILQHQSTLLPLIFPKEYAMLREMSASEIRNFALQSWSLQRLQEALQRLVALKDLPLKLCLFIDGLDEYESNKNDYDDHPYLIQLLTNLASSPYIKICVSSRPLLIFEEAFKEAPGLRLQDLTSSDIRGYVVNQLARNARMQELIQDETWQGQDFVHEICDKAQGVFLWVKLVVRSLLDGLRNWDRIADLRARLDLVPSDLEDLYRHMLTHIEPLYITRASEVFQLVRTARQVQDLTRKDSQRTTPVTVLLLALAMEGISGDSMATSSINWTAERLSSQCDTMRRRLQTWCAGLLEVPDFIWNRCDRADATAACKTKITWEIAYLHRTARDFLESEAIWKWLLQCTANTGFEPYTSLFKSSVQLYKVAGPVVANPLGYGLFRKELLEPILYTLQLAKRASVTTGNSHTELLEDFDHVVRSHLIRWTGQYDRYIGTHWSHFLDDRDLQGVKSSDSFLALAVSYELNGFVLAKVSNTRYHERWKQAPADPDTNKYPTTLLSIAVRPAIRSSGTAGILLENGANPNEISGFSSVWAYVLTRADAPSKQGSDGLKWLEIMRLFLEHDVNIRGDDEDLDYRADLLNLIDRFRKYHPSQVASLQALIKSKTSRRKRLKHWASTKLGTNRSDTPKLEAEGMEDATKRRPSPLRSVAS